MQHNGGSVIAMAGKDCVAIASDLRLGSQSLGISSNFEKVRMLLILVVHKEIENYVLHRSSP